MAVWAVALLWASAAPLNWSGESIIPEVWPPNPDFADASNVYLVVYKESNGEILGVLAFVPCSCAEDPTPAIGAGEGVLDVTDDPLIEDFIEWNLDQEDDTVWSVNVGEQELQHD